MITDVTFAKVVFILGNAWLFLGLFTLFPPSPLKTVREDRLRLALLLAFLVITALIIGLRRRDVGVDTPKYVAAFESGEKASYHALELYEPGYVYLGLALKEVLREYNFYLALVSFAMGFFILWAYRHLLKEGLYPLAFALYLSTFVFWWTNLSILRQGLAISLIFYVYALLEERRWRQAFLIYLLSCLWHFSALFFPAAYVLYHLYLYLYRRKPFIFWLVLGVVLANLAYPGSLVHWVVRVVVDYAYHLTGAPFFERARFYFFWPELTPWHVKHVYFLILALFVLAAFFIKKSEALLRAHTFILVGLTVLVLTKFDQMVADRMFMYFVPGVPLLILRLVPAALPLARDRNLAYAGVFLGAMVWFNVKFYLLQYASWFINPVRAIMKM